MTPNEMQQGCRKALYLGLKNQLYKHKMGGMWVYKCLHERAGRIHGHRVTRGRELKGFSGCIQHPDGRDGGTVTLEWDVPLYFQRKMDTMDWIQRQVTEPTETLEPTSLVPCRVVCEAQAG